MPRAIKNPVVFWTIVIVGIGLFGTGIGLETGYGVIQGIIAALVIIGVLAWFGKSKTVKTATKTCPFCAEEIQVQAIKCKHCGSDLSSP